MGLKSVSTVTNWEAGNYSPDRTNLVALADVLGVTVDYLLGRSNNKYDLCDMQEKYESCDEYGRSAINDCIEFHYQRANYTKEA